MDREEPFDFVAGLIVLRAALFDPPVVGEPGGHGRLQVFARADAAGGVLLAEEPAAGPTRVMDSAASVAPETSTAP